MKYLVYKSRFVTVTTLVQKFAIVAKPFSTVKLDIQFLAKEIHLLSSLIFKDDSMKMLKNGVNRLSNSCDGQSKNNKFSIWVSDYRTVGL